MTALSIALSSPASSTHCRRNSKVFLEDQHNKYRSSSNSLLARTADRTPKTRSKSINIPPSSKRSPYIVSPAGSDVTWNHLVHLSVSPLLIKISRRFQHL
ncbi:hypothetical protein AVEN_182902-1 [Araneus ventricosus]|uniref:Uncharacterized protein n=1 Tax=Araneus ventricosus TaxID=182803 RepID=A0A4Y2J010_ARAVE|nr:hypothetical protein AVEN_249177-1 [Araneus ventricosus]GBM83567.1 hypothetical protein AVEN_151430-1 [Araneus ventricosus]GBM83601.1 hypothetical protein AVEN_182902-1 [Araneus ventricosus]